MNRGDKRPSSPQPSPPSGEEREKSALAGSWSQYALKMASGLPMNREKPDAKGTVSPLTPALSPLRGEGEKPGASAGGMTDDLLSPALSSKGGEGEDSVRVGEGAVLDGGCSQAA